MAANQKRWLTMPKSKLSSADVVDALRRDDAWIFLPEDTRRQLYSALPAPREEEPPHDIDVHPLQTRYKSHIEAEIRRWQDDLKEGREAKKWRQEAMLAGKERAEGKWDEWKEKQREEEWGKRDENSQPVEKEKMDVGDQLEEKA